MNSSNSPIKHSGRSIKKLYRQAVRALRTSNHADALLLTQEIISRQEDHAGAHAVQFSSLFKNKKFELARLIGNKAAELNPKSVFILNNQACLELECNNPTPAAGLLSSLIDQFGERAQWLYNLGFAHELSGQYSTAISMFRKTLDQNPQHDKAARQLAETLEKVGHFEEATQAYDYWRLLSHNNAASHAQYIQCAANSDNINPQSLSKELSYWGDRFIPKSQHYETQDIRHKENLYIGFITNHLPISWLERIVIPTINKLPNAGDHVTVYCHGLQLKLNDNINTVDATLLSDADFARKVRADEVDVLIDLCGMRKLNRQRALGLQLASKQFAWLGHQGGFATSLITPLEDVLASSNQFSIQARTNQQNSGPWPEKTFASIGAEHGLSYRVIKTWAGVLLRCADWQLHLPVKANSSIGKLLSQRFSAAGVNRDRLRFDQNLNYDKTTIALDNFSLNDPVTLSDALLAGANIITLKGTHFPGQQSQRLLQQLGSQTHINETEFEFIQQAVNLAKNGIANATKFAPEAEQQLNDFDAFASQIRNAIVN